MTEFVSLLLGYFQNLGYGGIVALMAVESSFIPFPSEIIMPPAGYLAAQGQFNIILVIIAGVIGSLIGALINYALACYLGRKIIYALSATKWAKWFMITPKKIERAEDYFLRHGNTSTLVGRLVPAVRQLISLPAGLAKMSLPNFLLYTALGSAIWTTILALLGYWLGNNQHLLSANFEMLSIFGTLLFIAFIFYLIFTYRRKKPYGQNH